MLKYYSDKYEIKKMCDRAVDSCLLILKFVPDWFLTNKLIKNHDIAVFFDDYIVFGVLGSDSATYFSEDIVPSSINQK